MKFLKQVWGGWTDGTVAYDLAQRAQRSNVLAWVEMRFPAARNPAKACDFAMVVKKFDGKEMNFTGKRQAHNKGMHPVLASRCANSSQVFWPIATIIMSPDSLRLGYPERQQYYQKIGPLATPENSTRLWHTWMLSK